MSTTTCDTPAIPEADKKFTGFKVECWVDGLLVSRMASPIDHGAHMDFGFPVVLKDDLNQQAILTGYDLVPKVFRV
jgi:hypothetical protein